ncbi:Deoxyribonuclease-2-alpha [Trichinella nativa]|uniref:Deoxyribonuclease-2-alpha n=1 Tax=Trichinella nativa TaxID=6335 RepID=A0A0V1LF82_9BILA|nr:Deoxyribonuclease-2-alpha [Trichinella nativa]
MQLANSQVSREADSAKWVLIEGKNIVCFTTSDYKMNEKRIPGAAVCLENAGVYTAFTAAAFNLNDADSNNCDFDITGKQLGARYFVYKPPNVLQTKIMQSGQNQAWARSAQSIESNNGHSIVQTMAHFVAENQNIKVLAYSDDPPNLPPRNEKSKAKGVLLIDNTVTNAATWFIHTVPKFLSHLGGYSWPQTETAKGHIFLCLSINEESLNAVARAIRYQEPYIYASNLPAELLNQHNELSNLATGVEIRVTPFLEHTKLTTRNNGMNIEAFGKHTKSYADMYERVLRKKLSARIKIWAPSDIRSKSICKGQYHLRKIASPIQLDGDQVYREADSAKWALIEGKNTVCLTTNDYKTAEKRIPGAAVCVENANVYNAFNTAAVNVLACNMRTDAAAWFIHTVPNFLAHLGGYSWPPAETAKGHIFLCLSFREEFLNSVAKAIRYQEPYIYANNLPVAILNQHEELSNLVNGVEVRVTPFLEHARFVTKRKQVEASIQAFGKHTKSFADMYARILRNKFSASIRIWAPSDVKSKSFCKGQYKLRKIASPMQFADNEVSREADSAKWALVEGKNTVCLTTNDYKITEKRIPGVLLIDKRRTDAAAWFIHSVSNFLAHLGGYSWLPAETAKGHIFLCMSFREEFLNSVVALRKLQHAKMMMTLMYFVYKPPNGLNTKIIKSEVNPRWSNSATSIDVTPGQSIARTMVHYVQNDPQIKVLAYNDDPPNIPAKNRKSKAKGVLLIDKRQNDAAAWFVHTVPNFLAHLGGYSWPQTETAKGHIFLCLSFREEFLNSVGKAIRYQEPYIYANNLPADILNQHKELSNLVNGVEIRVTPFLENAKFVTKNAQVQANIQAFGKHSKSFADIYGRVLRKKLSANIRIWAPSDAKSKSICKGQYKLQKIDSPIQFADNQVSREADSAKWALVEGKNTVCLTTNDYKNSEKKVPGAAVCIENANVYNAFSQAASNVLPCNK